MNQVKQFIKTEKAFLLDVAKLSASLCFVAGLVEVMLLFAK